VTSPDRERQDPIVQLLPSGTVIFAQLGVLSNIEAAIAASSSSRA